MSGRVRSITGHEPLLVGAVWQVCATPPGAIDGPRALDPAGIDWIEAPAAQTAASVLRAAGRWSLEGPPRRFDGEDWWYRVRFARPAPGGELVLCCDGLATIAEVWLNGAPLLSSRSMFVEHEVRLDALTADNELVLRFAALDPLLAMRRPRPRWRAPMIEHPQLRWFRTTLLGRTPGWSPPAPPVGPWRPVRLEHRRHVAVEQVRLAARLEGRVGRVEIAARLRALEGNELGGVEAFVRRGEVEHRAPLAGGAAQIEIPDPPLWWPHTHGEPVTWQVGLRISHRSGATEVDLGPVGFRRVEVETESGFGIRVNGAPVFCRGACWTPLDPVSLSSDRGLLAAAVAQAREAGMNMLRVSGTMAPESDDFLDELDRQGILLWQDLMFANQDYPEEEASFAASVEQEVRQLLARLQGRPSVAVVCGNSEGAQQAAMWGATRDRWSPKLFHETLPRLMETECPDLFYWPSSAQGGAFPHQADVGTTSYYGVGAYLRPLEDARRAEVRFATECLAFANIPSAATLEQPGAPPPRVHHPAWKARTPRDLGAGWDFDDVRDHYLGALFRVDPMRLRYGDPDRYLALGRVATGEVMAATFSEWRRRRSTCKGALVWFLRDLWLGAGWGLVDAAGVPKAAYHYVRRALAPVALALSDEGGNGLFLHLCNETATPLRGELELALYQSGELDVGRARTSVEVAARETLELPAAALFDHFRDLSYAYRFGPPGHDLVVATLRSDGREVQAFAFPTGLPAERVPEVGLLAEARARSDGDLELRLRTRRFAQSIAVDVPGFVPEDDFFHLAPGAERTLRLRPTGQASASRGTLSPLNALTSTKVVTHDAP